MSAKIVVGVDIGGTCVKFGIFDENKSLLYKWSEPTDLSEQGTKIIPEVHRQITSKIKKLELQLSDLKGIGMGIPGPVDSTGFVENCVNLNWNNVNPAKELEAFFPNIVIKAENDANVAALGEYVQGAGKAYKSAMLITIGTGIGGGIVLDGNILHGAHGLAGEIGHIAMDRNAKERCNCGNLGCVDHIASASGIVRIMRELLLENDTDCVLRGLPDFSAKDICDAAKDHDELASRCIDICMEPLARGMATFTHAFDPEVFIIGGGVSSSGETILEPLRIHYQENLFLTNHGADIIAASLGNDAGMIGAAMQVL